MRRVPDGFQATLAALASRSEPERERLLAALARSLGKEALPLFRAAALGPNDALARSAVRMLPAFGSRAAADLLAEIYAADPTSERAALAREAGLALRARGISVDVPEPETTPDHRLTLRETWCSPPGATGSRSVLAFLQDRYGVWHAIAALCNDRTGLLDAWTRPMSRHEWLQFLRERPEGPAHLPCPPDFARWTVALARRIAEPSRPAVQEALAAWDRWVGPPPEDYRRPDPTGPVRAAERERYRRWLEESVELLERPEAEAWSLEPSEFTAPAREWDRLARVRGDAEAAAECLRETAKRAFSPETLELYRERLLDLARAFEWKQDVEASRRAAAAALAIERGLGPAEHPFLLGILRRTFEMALAAQGFPAP